MIQSPLYWIVLALSLPIYWRLPSTIRPAFLAAVSIAYLLTLDVHSVLALSGWALLFFFLARRTTGGGRQGTAVTAGLTVAVAAFLFLTKNTFDLHALGTAAPLAPSPIVPLGASYYTFKLIHYLAERSRGNITDSSLGSFLSYLFLFPTFTAGPIERYDHFLENRRGDWNRRTAAEGLRRIADGLIKKFFLAEFLITGLYGKITSVQLLGEHLPDATALQVWYFLLLSYLSLYLDFSAYSDIAIGTCRLFGIRIMENFNYPFLACSIVDFWRRWHMTLMHWCRSYVYMPLLGLTRRPGLSILATFLVFGLWHSASGPRILWALYHAAGVILYNLWTRAGRQRGWSFPESQYGRLGGMVCTQLFVVAGMSFLLAEEMGNLALALRIMAALIGIHY